MSGFLWQEAARWRDAIAFSRAVHRCDFDTAQLLADGVATDYAALGHPTVGIEYALGAILANVVIWNGQGRGLDEDAAWTELLGLIDAASDDTETGAA